MLLAELASSACCAVIALTEFPRIFEVKFPIAVWLHTGQKMPIRGSHLDLSKVCAGEFCHRCPKKRSIGQGIGADIATCALRIPGGYAVLFADTNQNNHCNDFSIPVSFNIRLN
jgi:hypothetical protein